MGIVKRLSDCILPTKCVMCGHGVNVLLCPTCVGRLRFVDGRRCSACGVPCAYYHSGNRCLGCVLKPFAFSFAQGIILYDDFASQLLYKYKFHDQISLTSSLAELMLERIDQAALNNSDILLPVPIHRLRMLKRKYNQAALLAKYISKRAGLAWDGCSLLRTKRTLHQHGLSYRMRCDNIKNAFVLKNDQKFVGKNVLLIDDLMTTGATFNECARVALERGAAKVRCVALFRAAV